MEETQRTYDRDVSIKNKPKIPKFLIWIGAAILIFAVGQFVYDSAYNSGYDLGYTEGEEYGYDSGYELGEVLGYQDGYQEAWGVGYDKGYLDAFKDGYEVGKARKKNNAESYYSSSSSSSSSSQNYYSNSQSSSSSSQNSSKEKSYTYILNKSSKKFHYSTCYSVKRMKESNKITFYGTRTEVLNKGYDPCGNCNP